MAKHYPQQKQSARGGFRQLTLLSMFFVLGYLCASLFSFSQLMNWVGKHLFPEQAHSHLEAKNEKSHLPKPTFEFYTLLTKEHPTSTYVTPPRHAALTSKQRQHQHAQPPHVPAPVVEPQGHEIHKPQSSGAFLVQVASFRKKQDAERMRASLVLKGFTVNIAAVSRNGANWHRVMIGPYQSRMQAEKAQKEIAHSEHVTGMIRKMEA